MTETSKLRILIDAEDRASKTLKGLASTSAASFAAIGKAALQFSAVAGGAMAVLGGFAVKSAGEYQQNAIAFETMLGSTEKAQKLLKQVSDFAAQTPFELPQVVTGAKQLLAYGVEAEKLIPTFKTMGNIAAGVGTDKLPDLIRAFGQVRAKGKLMAQELNQFAEAGVPLREMLAKDLKMSLETFSTELDKGNLNIKFSQVEKSLNKLSGEGGKFFNLMEKQSKTFGGTVSNIKDQFGRLARSIVGISDTGEIRRGSIFGRLTEAAKLFLDFLNRNAGKIQQFFMGLTNLITQTFQIITPIIQGFITNSLRLLLQAWEYLKPSVSSLADSIVNELIPALTVLWEEVIGPVVEILGPIAGKGLVWALKLVIDTTKLAVKAVTLLSNWASSNKDILAAVAAAVGLIGANMAIMATPAFIANVGKAAAAGWLFVAPWLALALKVAAITLVFTSIMKFADWLSKKATGHKFMDQLNAIFQYDLKTGKKGNATWEALKDLVGTNAEGTNYWKGGPTWVGEKGPEIVNLPKGSTVTPNNEIPMSGVNVTINMSGSFNLDSQERVDELARRITQLLGRQTELAKIGVGF